MVAIDVVMAIFTARSAARPRWRDERHERANEHAPANAQQTGQKPVARPSRASSTIRMGRHAMWARNRCLQLPPDRILNQGSRWARSAQALGSSDARRSR